MIPSLIQPITTTNIITNQANNLITDCLLCHICGRRGHHGQSCAANIQLFVWPHGGNEVYLTGNFSHWQAKQKMLRDKTNPNLFTLELSLSPSKYEYKFIVDGLWRHNPDTDCIPDGIGGHNNIVEILPVNDINDEDHDLDEYSVHAQSACMNPWSNFRIVKMKYNNTAQWVSIKGSWDHWKNEIPLKKVRDPFTSNVQFYVNLKILPGAYTYKYLVDGKWTIDHTAHVIKTPDGYENNQLVVRATINVSAPQHIVTFDNSTKLKWTTNKINYGSPKVSHTFQGHSMDLIADKLYIFGGIVNGQFTNSMFIFDHNTMEFSSADQIGDIPSPRAFHRTCTFGTKILLYGGFNEQYLNDYYVYNSTNKEWTCNHDVEETAPKPRERSSLVNYDTEKLILFGGYYCNNDMSIQKFMNDIWCLDLKSMIWTAPSVEGEYPEARSAHTATVIHKRMYVFGGQTYNNKNLNDVSVLKMTEDGTLKWCKFSPNGISPEPRHGHSAISINYYIIIFAGRGNDNKTYNDVHVLDTLNHTWIQPSIRGDIPTPRYYHAVCPINNHTEILLFGGVKPKSLPSLPKMYILSVEDIKREGNSSKNQTRLDDNTLEVELSTRA